jgi:hypothetical protein
MYGTCSGCRSLPLCGILGSRFWVRVFLVGRPFSLRARNFSETRLTSGSPLLLCRPRETGWRLKRERLERDFQISACGDRNDRYGCPPEFYGFLWECRVIFAKIALTNSKEKLDYTSPLKAGLANKSEWCSSSFRDFKLAQFCPG